VEPAEVIQAAGLVEGHLRRRTEPHVPLRRRQGRTDRLGESRHDVAERADTRAPHLADVTAAKKRARALVMRARALLRADLDDAFVRARRVQHPFAFAVGMRQRFLDVDILARCARQNRHQRVPMVGRRDDDRVDVGTLQHPPEIGVSRRVVARRRHALVHSLVRHLRDADNLAVGLGLEVEQMALADQADADEADADAIVRADHAPAGCRGRHRGGGESLQKRAAIGGHQTVEDSGCCHGAR
jgi:hypothetical protein